MLLVAVLLFVGDCQAWPWGRSQCPGGKCPTAPNYRKPTDPQPVNPRPYVVRVRCGNVAGSGTVIQWNGVYYALTAKHVVGSAKRAKFKGPSGVYRDATIVARTGPYDMALLKPDDQTGLSATDIGDGRPVDNQELIRVGYGGNGYYQEDRGRFLNKVWTPSGGDTAEWAKTTALARSGDSGGPILDATGRLVGVLHHKAIANGPGQTIFTVAGRVREFLNKSLGPESAPLENTLIAESQNDSPTLVPDHYARDTPPSCNGCVIDLPDVSTSDPSVLESLYKKPVITPIPDGVNELVKDAIANDTGDSGGVAATDGSAPLPVENHRFLDPEPVTQEQKKEAGDDWLLVLLVLGCGAAFLYFN